MISETLVTKMNPDNKITQWWLPVICANCHHLGTEFNSTGDSLICRKGVAFPIKKKTCYRYEGWL